MRHLAPAVMLLLLGAAVAAPTPWVIRPDGSGDFATIQDGLDGAASGDELILVDGVYSGPGNYNLDFLGKALAVRSQSGDPASCIIDCQESGRGFTFVSGEDDQSLVEGVTVTNGQASYGGAIYCSGTAPSLQNCVFSHNACLYRGGGIYAKYSSPALTHCLLLGNEAGSYGGGLFCIGNSDPQLVNCTLVGNAAPSGGGVYCTGNPSPMLQNTIVAFGPEGAAVDGYSGCSITLSCCDIHGNAGGDWTGVIEDQFGINGNISADPLFCGSDDPTDPYTLHADSPCSPVENPDCGLIGARPVGCGATEHMCCIADVCQVLTCADCDIAGGDWYPGYDSCDPNPCTLHFVIYPDGSGDLPTIQAAIDAALPGCTIELDDGVFDGDGNRDLDFRGKSITVRSMADDPTLCSIDCAGVPDDHHRGISFLTGEDSTAVLRGITIANAYAVEGAGARCIGASPTLVNCVFLENQASNQGGGLYAADFASPTLIGCRFEGNSGGATGGGVCLNSGSCPVFTDCEFSQNSADGGGAIRAAASCNPTIAGCSFVGGQASFGAGIRCDYSSPTLTECTFEANAATLLGGALYLDGYSCYAQATHCTLIGNTAELEGGGVYIGSWAQPVLSNCTLSENGAFQGGGIHLASCRPHLRNLIIAFGTSGEALSGTADQLEVVCCDVYGNEGGDWVEPFGDLLGEAGNISGDPIFCGDLNPLLPYLLHGDSPCAPEQNPNCGLIGAWPVGCGHLAGVEDRGSDPMRTMLYKGRPNPFGSVTAIRYDLPQETRVDLRIHDVTGRTVRVLVDGMVDGGSHRSLWDGRNDRGQRVGCGIYFYTLRAGSYRRTHRAVMIR